MIKALNRRTGHTKRLATKVEHLCYLGGLRSVACHIGKLVQHWLARIGSLTLTVGCIAVDDG